MPDLYTKRGLPIQASAEFSECGKFRYQLDRRWADGARVCFVMLNCSLAGADKSDPTVTRCVNYAEAWGFGSLTVLNLYPYITPYPKELKAAMKKIDVTGGVLGYAALRSAIYADLVIVAWGVHATEHAAQRFYTISKPKSLWCLGFTRDGKPLHPLMQRADLTPQPFMRCERMDWREALKGKDAA